MTTSSTCGSGMDHIFLSKIIDTYKLDYTHPTNIDSSHIDSSVISVPDFSGHYYGYDTSSITTLPAPSQFINTFFHEDDLPFRIIKDDSNPLKFFIQYMGLDERDVYLWLCGTEHSFTNTISHNRTTINLEVLFETPEGAMEFALTWL